VLRVLVQDGEPVRDLAGVLGFLFSQSGFDLLLSVGVDELDVPQGLLDSLVARQDESFYDFL
jgi:hypothetical protein